MDGKGNEKLKDALQKIVERLKNELASLRTGRASAALVEDLEVEYYGAKTPLKALAAIATPDPRQIVIQPWDKNAVQPIEKAIRDSSIGLNPVVDREAIRLAIPPLTEERRKELAKLVSRHAEDARIAVRKMREEAIKEIDRKEKAKEISEDQKFREREAAQKAVDEANKNIEEAAAAKEKEIMSG